VRQHAAAHATRRVASAISSFAVVATVAALAGCGSSSTSSSSSPAPAPTTSSATAAAPATSTTAAPAGASAVSLEANKEGQLEYNTKSLTAKAGKVTVDFSNPAPLAHNVTIESSSGATVGNTPTFTGGSKKLTVTLKPGTYKFFCSVPGHRQAGMEGTLTVN
jgi:plastocyanin